MAFVKLRNLQGKEIKISKSAAGAYRNLGFYPEEEFAEGSVPVVEKEIEDEEIDNVEDESLDPVDEEDANEDEEEVFINSLSKKPLNSWNKDEVKRYAAFYDIDLAGTKNANEAKERIKAFMSNAE